MIKKKCQQCGKSFEAKRTDSLYCSNACKQQAHYKRAIEKMKNTNEEPQDKEMTVFYMDEYQAIDWEGMDLITYCFLRRVLPLVVSKDDILAYLNSMIMDDRWEWRDNYNRVRQTKVFKDYEERFLNGEIKILPKKPTESPIN